MTQIYEDGTYFDNNPSWHEEDSSWKANLLKYPRMFAFAVNKDLAVRLLGGYSLLVLAK